MVRRSVLVSGIVLALIASVALSQEEPKGAGRKKPASGGSGFRAPGFGGGFGGQGFGGPGFGGFGPMQGSSIMLLAMPEVQKELGLSDEQKKEFGELQRKSQEQMRSSFGNFQEMQDLSREEREKRFAEARKKSEEAVQQAEEKLSQILDAKQLERLGQLRVQREGFAALNRPEIAKRLELTADQQERIRKIQEDARAQARGGIGGPDASEVDRREAIARIEKQREMIQADIITVLTDRQKEQCAEMRGKPFKFPQQGFGAGGFGPGGRPGGGGFGAGGKAEERRRPPLKKRDQ